MSAPHNPCKTALNSRLHMEGRSQAFKDLREHYKRLKVPARIAWQAAAQSFPDGSGVCTEVPLTPEISAALELVARVKRVDDPPRMANGWVDYERSGEKELPEFKDAWLRLRSEVPAGKRANKLAMIEFWQEYSDTPPQQIDPELVPNRGSLRFLKRIQSSDVIYDEFMRSIWAKTLPTQKQLEKSESQQEDSAPLLKLLDDFDASFHEESHEAGAEVA